MDPQTNTNIATTGVSPQTSSIPATTPSGAVPLGVGAAPTVPAPSATHTTRNVLLVVLLLVIAVLGALVYVTPEEKRQSVLGLLPFSLPLLDSVPSEGDLSQPVASTTESVAPQVPTSYGVIYTKGGAASVQSPQEFFVYSESEKSKSAFDVSVASPWKAMPGAPVVLYKVTPSTSAKNILSITANDLQAVHAVSVEVSLDVDIASSLVYSPFAKQVGYCSDENEGSFMTHNLASGEKKPYTSYSGCVTNVVSEPPQFAQNGSVIYYKEVAGLSEDGTDSKTSKLRAQRLDVDESYDTTQIALSSREVVDKSLVYPVIRSTKKTTTSYDNLFELYNVTGGVADSLTSTTVLKQPRVLSVDVGTTSHVGSFVATRDGKGFYFYVYEKQSKLATSSVSKLGYVDVTTKEVTYPQTNLGVPAGTVSLIRADTQERLVFSSLSGSTTDLYLYNDTLGAVSVIDTNVGVQKPENVHFVAK